MAKTVDLRKMGSRVLQERKVRFLQQIQTPPDFLRASFVKQYLTCGKKNCRCSRGFKHGPFYYLVQCLGAGRVRKFLLKTSECPCLEPSLDQARPWLAHKLLSRADGIYGAISWTQTGKAAVDGGDYRFFSTEYDPADLKILNDGGLQLVRPLRLDGLTLTNDPNNKGGRPITNRIHRPAPADGRCPDCGRELDSCTVLHNGDPAAHSLICQERGTSFALDPRLTADD